MFNKVLEYAKKPSTWVLIALGVIAATAFSVLRKPARIVASKIPGNDVAPTA